MSDKPCNPPRKDKPEENQPGTLPVPLSPAEVQLLRFAVEQCCHMIAIVDRAKDAAGRTNPDLKLKMAAVTVGLLEVDEKLAKVTKGQEGGGSSY